MHKLLEYLMDNDLFMSFRPDAEARCMVITFRKTLSNGITFSRQYRMSGVEINLLNIDNLDVLLDFAERFMKDYNEEDAKYWN